LAVIAYGLPSRTPISPISAAGFTMAGRILDNGFLRALFAGPAAALLRGLNYPYVAFKIDDATLALQRNGYTPQAAALDELALAACEFARCIRDACRVR